MTARFRREENITRAQKKHFKKTKLPPAPEVPENKSEGAITRSFFEHFSRAYHGIKEGYKTREALLLVIVLLFLLTSVAYLLPRIFSLHFDPVAYFQKVFTGDEAAPSQIQKDTDYDVLILGRGGFENDAPYLTDSIMVLHYDHITQSAVTVSIPRDLFVRSKVVGRAKINEVYSDTRNALNETAATQELLDVVNEVTGRNVTLYAMVDFAGFRKLIDVLGGIDVEVPERLYDNEYPNSSWGYMTVDIPAGIQHFDGAKALQYARSRHTTSDFDRSKRQQLVISAVREKLLSAEILTSPRKIQSLFSTLSSSVTTNIGIADMLRIAQTASKVEKTNIHSYTLDISCFDAIQLCHPGGLLYTPERDLFGGLSVILPKTATVSNLSSYLNIHSFVDTVMSYPAIENARPLAILNASGRTGIASTVALKLKSQGVPVDPNNLKNYPEKIDASFVRYNPGLVKADDPMVQVLSYLFLGPSRPATDAEVLTMVAPYELVLGKDSSLYFK